MKEREGESLADKAGDRKLGDVVRWKNVRSEGWVLEAGGDRVGGGSWIQGAEAE